MRSRALQHLLLILAVLVAVGSVDAAVWRQVTPALRRSSAMTVDTSNHRAILFGGTNDHLQGDWYNDVWSLRLDTVAGYAWSPLNVTGTPPVGRACQAQVYDPVHQRLIIWAGSPDMSHVFSEVWALNLTSGSESWQRLSVDSGPCARRYTYTIYDPERNRIITFGGTDCVYDWWNDVWELNLDSLVWHQLFPSGTPPDIRCSGAAFLDQTTNQFVIFGGSNNTDCFNDIWTMDLTPDSERWTQVTTGGNPPSPRCNVAYDYDALGRRLFVFGGYDLSNLMNDFYVYDVAAASWTKIYPASELPVARRNSCGCYDPFNGNFIVFGGDLAGDYYLSGTDYINVGTSGVAEWPAREIPQKPRTQGISATPRADGAFDLRYSVVSGGKFKLSVIDAAGQTVRELAAGFARGGDATTTWDARDSRGERVPAGSYFCLLQVNGLASTAKVCVVR
jgi:N-acetylneuraminic acid mutarotase